jgi:phosphoglycolate phosphatase
MNIFFDLDGTLLDSKERLYQLFQHLVPASKLSFMGYWELKRNKISHREILTNQFSYTDTDYLLFEDEWMQRIELQEWLSLDKPFEGVTDYLRELKGRYKLYIITARQFKDVAMQQIKLYNWDELFEGILVTGQKREKYDMVKAAIVLSEDDWLVGDTGKDIQTGQKLGIHTAAVLSGFLNKKSLEKYSPDKIVNSVLDLDFEQY